MGLRRTARAAVLLLAAAPATNAHTWVEFVYRIGSTGSFTGKPGYPIGYIPRDQGVSDDLHQTKILDTSTNPPVCKPLSSSDAAKYPPLKAAPGDYIAMQYQENGHVTQPEQTMRPYRGGNIYVYGTSEHQDADGINDVLNAWTPDGKGGNQKGRLLASHYFDDDQCFQDAPGNPIATERKAKYGVNELFCQTDLQLPADLPTQGTYTLMWVWDWPRIIDDTHNVTEIYASCAQIELTGSAGGESVGARPSIKFDGGGDIQSAAISSQLHNLIEATALGVGTNSPAAPTGVATDQPAPTSSSVVEVTPSPTAPSTNEGDGNGGIKTVTVTAEPETFTQYRTVVMGPGGHGSGGASQPTAAPSQPTATAPVASFPTSLVPVTSVHGFLKVRGARVTGQARREYLY